MFRSHIYLKPVPFEFGGFQGSRRDLVDGSRLLVLLPRRRCATGNTMSWCDSDVEYSQVLVFS